MPNFWQLATTPILKIQSFFGYIDSYTKIFLILYPSLENSTTCIAILTGNKSRLWTRKCGNEENVAHVLQQYKAFVSKNKIFQEFHKAFLEFKDVSEDYKNNANLSVSERTEIDKFIQDVQQKWVTFKYCLNPNWHELWK